MKSSLTLEDEIRYLLTSSNWQGRGPHGRTIWAVMNRVKLLRKRATSGRIKHLKLVRKAG